MACDVNVLNGLACDAVFDNGLECDVLVLFGCIMLWISCTDRNMNKEVQETDERRKQIRDIRPRQSKFIGHVMRRNKRENMVTTDTFVGETSHPHTHIQTRTHTHRSTL